MACYQKIETKLWKTSSRLQFYMNLIFEILLTFCFEKGGNRTTMWIYDSCSWIFFNQEVTNSLTCTQQSEFFHIAPHHHFYWICPYRKGEEDYGARMGIVFIRPHIFRNFQEALTVTYCEFIFQESSWNISYSCCCWFWTLATMGNELLVCKALPHFTC